MSSAKLKEDLSNCLINFDRRVLITELLDDYKLTYEQVNQVVQEYLMEQENKENLKYEKRFLVHGMQEGEQKKEIYKIVEEANLNEWLLKLKNVESSLYSVEVTGGAKVAAPVFKPMRIDENVKIKARKSNKSAAANGTAETAKSVTEKKDIKQENNTKKDPSKNPFTAKSESIVKKTSPKSESSPTDKKAADKKTVAKKGINNFFAPTSNVSKKAEDTKDSKAGAIKHPTPKKMQDFFKKQAENPKTSTANLNKAAANSSVQLFDNDEEVEPEEISSDEEEKLEALKRDIISSDVEMEAEDEGKPAASGKRRRILDSDDEEEDPPVKQEKLDVKEETRETEEEAVAETYLDQEGFVITKKPKQKATNKSPTTKKTPPVTIKTSPKETKKSSSSSTNNTKVATNPAAKTKQPQIMNFFSKK